MTESILINLKELYEVDNYLWIQETVKLLEEKKFNDLDLDNLIEEIVAMGISQKRELKSRLRVLIMHLLKYQYQSQKISESWLSTIIEQRCQLEDLLEFNPSLRQYIVEIIEKCYLEARKNVSKETELPLNQFPLDNPFTVEQILDEDWFPKL
ncbi:DUF29 domain-containing protein [Geminocystis sp. CENA526]|uniref:DUF29 domain-containing protein n=1 Tax=Geminocystis sp. CENA526 TaxID=1355871 RepID=UPI003D6E1AF6